MVRLLNTTKYIYTEKLKRMKKIFGIALFVAASFASTAQDITVEEIVDNYLEAIGGREAWSKVNGHKMIASASVQGMDLPIVNQDDYLSNRGAQ